MPERALAVACAGALIGVALLVPARPGGASYSYARATGKRCATCHDSTRPGIDNLNQEGRRFLVERRVSEPGQDLPGLQAEPTAGEVPPLERPAAAAPGAAVFVRACAPCHGARGEGTPAGVPLTGELSHGRDPEQLLAVVRGGVSGTAMFGFDEILSEDEIAAVAGYVAKLER